MKIFRLFILSYLLIVQYGCTKETHENILGLWDIEKITASQETLQEPHLTLYTTNYDGIGKIFFRSNGDGSMQIENLYPDFKLHQIGVSNFTWMIEGDVIYFDGFSATITKSINRSIEFERVVLYNDYQEKIIYMLKKL